MSEFVRDRLGVAEASLSVTGTEVIAIPGSPLGSDLGPWGLTFPFPDWSDALITYRAGTRHAAKRAAVHRRRGAPGAGLADRVLLLPAGDARRCPSPDLLGRTLVWLSPMGESRLEAPPVAAEGSRIPITLTLGLATSSPPNRLARRAAPPVAGQSRARQPARPVALRRGDACVGVER